MTLEIFLNLAWLILACAAYGKFAFWCARQPRGRRDKKVLIALAVTCAVALLFPIISVTDDLHSDATALEESTSARRTSLIASPQIAVPIVNTAEQIAHQMSLCVGVLVVAPPAAAASSFATASALRGPPQS